MMKVAVDNELFIVEEKNFALASENRNRFNQALLEVGPSVVKVSGARIDRLLDDEDIKSIISGLGASFNISPEFNMVDLEKLRYWKVVVVTEPTKDGRHIQKQVLSFLHQYMNPLVRAGHVFVVPSQDWGSMSPKEFAAKVLDPETREIVQIPGNPGD